MKDAYHADQRVTLDEALGWLDAPIFVIDVIENPDRPYVISGINKAYERVTGVAAVDVVGHPLDDILPARLAATVKRNYDRCVACKDTVTYEELLEIGGTEKWWFTTLNPRLDHTGCVYQIVGLTRDITAQKTEGMALATEMAELSALNSELRTLTAMAAHDLRGPLGTLESLLDLLLEDFLDMGDGKTELLTASLDVITTLRPQIEALLARAMSLDPKTSRLQDVDLGHMCSDLAALIDPLGEKTIAYPSDIIQADPIAVQLVLRNLLDNASRYAETTIQVTLDKSDPKSLAITVDDDGPGLDLSTLNQQKGASGFGLNAVRHMVQSRGGALAINPNGALGGLSTRFTLPASH